MKANENKHYCVVDYNFEEFYYESFEEASEHARRESAERRCHTPIYVGAMLYGTMYYHWCDGSVEFKPYEPTEQEIAMWMHPELFAAD